MPRISQHSFVACQFFSSKNAKVSFSSFSSVGVLSFCSWYYFSLSLPLLLRSRPHVPRFDFRLSLLSERGFISRAAAGNQVNTWYDVRSCTKSIIIFPRIRILFREASQWAWFVVASFSCSYFFVSSFRRLNYIKDSSKPTFPAFVARGSHRPKQYGEKGDGGGVHFKVAP